MGLTCFLALGAPDTVQIPGFDVGAGIRGLVGVVVVLGLVALFAWLLRRGVFGPVGGRGTAVIRVETAVPLGERRSVIVVAVEGRRLLLGLAPGQVSFLTELQTAKAGFANALERAVDPPARGTS